MDIYIKPVKKANITGKTAITIKDVAEVIAPKGQAPKIKQLTLMRVPKGAPKANYLISVTDIIQAIQGAHPNSTVNNVGAQDTVVQYAPQASKDNPLWKWTKVAVVAVILMAGSATAIMSFQNDAQIPKVFESYHRIFYGESAGKRGPLLLNISYSIGLALGIVVFYNHFMGKKITEDPTPLEVEMSLYETEVNETMLDVLNTQQGTGKKDGLGRV